MIRFAVDEDFDNRIVRGLLRLLPTLDIVRAQDAGLLGKRDPEVLEWPRAKTRSPGNAQGVFGPATVTPLAKGSSRWAILATSCF